MVRSNLALLLAERNLKITKVSADTGISRTTLTALCNNYSQGIQFDTLNELCLYLDVEVSDLIAFIPVEVGIVDIGMTPYTGPVHRNLDIFICICYRLNEYQIVPLDGYLSEQRSGDTINRLEVVIDVPDDYPDNEDSVRANELIRQSFEKLPRAFFPVLEKALDEKLFFMYSDRQLSENMSVTYIWSDDLIRRNNR